MYKLSLIYLVKEQSGCENQKQVHSTNELVSDVIDTSAFYPREVVELCGIEPQTSCVQGRRSPS